MRDEPRIRKGIKVGGGHLRMKFSQKTGGRKLKGSLRPEIDYIGM